MAERRSIHRKVSASDDLAALGAACGGWAVAFALSLIPHYDRWGCVSANPRSLKLQVMPLHETVTFGMVQAWIDYMVEHGMLERVTGPTGAEGLRNTRFEDHQRGARLDRESPSSYEPPEVTEAFRQARTDHPERFEAGSEYLRERHAKEARKVGQGRGKRSGKKRQATALQPHSDHTPECGPDEPPAPVDNPGKAPETQPHSDHTPTTLRLKEGKEGKGNPSSLPSNPTERAGRAANGEAADPLPPHDLAQLATHAPPGPIARRLQTLTQERQ